MIANAIINLRPGQGFSIHGDVTNRQEYIDQTQWVVDVDEDRTAIYGEIENPPTWNEIQEEIKRIMPIHQWKFDMAESDFTMMPRAREHAISKIDNGIADNEAEQKRYDLKIALRKKKPITVE